MTPTRFTPQQILCGLPEIWSQLSGTDEAILHAETCIYDVMISDGTSHEIDFYDVKIRLQQHFQFTCSNDEWSDFLGMNQPDLHFETWLRDVSPQLTFAALAEFIAQRTSGISFSELAIATSVCRSAGAFTGIQESLHRTVGTHTFGPSDQITDVVQGTNLLACWTQLRWQTENKIPDLPDWFQNLHCHSYCLSIAIFLAAVGLSIAQNSGWPIVVSALLILILGISTAIISRSMNPLPKHLQTFRQLAKHIAS